MTDSFEYFILLQEIRKNMSKYQKQMNMESYLEDNEYF